MKKIFAFILTAAMLMSFAACASTKTEEKTETESETITETEKEEGKIESSEKEETSEPTPVPDNEKEETPESEKKDGESESASEVPADPTPEITQPEVGENEPLNILNTIWDSYADDEKFPATGGDYDTMSADAPNEFGVSDAEVLNSMLGLPQDQATNLACAASLMHMMNVNTFTCGAFQLNEGVDLAALAEALKTNIMGRHWMCGFPDTLIIYQIGDNIVVSAFGNAELIANFGSKLAAAYADAVLLYEESLDF